MARASDPMLWAGLPVPRQAIPRLGQAIPCSWAGLPAPRQAIPRPGQAIPCPGQACPHAASKPSPGPGKRSHAVGKLHAAASHAPARTGDPTPRASLPTPRFGRHDLTDGSARRGSAWWGKSSEKLSSFVSHHWSIRPALLEEVHAEVLRSLVRPCHPRLAYPRAPGAGRRYPSRRSLRRPWWRRRSPRPTCRPRRTVPLVPDAGPDPRIRPLPRDQGDLQNPARTALSRRPATTCSTAGLLHCLQQLLLILGAAAAWLPAPWSRRGLPRAGRPPRAARPLDGGGGAGWRSTRFAQWNDAPTCF